MGLWFRTGVFTFSSTLHSDLYLHQTCIQYVTTLAIYVYTTHAFGQDLVNHEEWIFLINGTFNVIIAFNYYFIFIDYTTIRWIKIKIHPERKDRVRLFNKIFIMYSIWKESYNKNIHTIQINGFEYQLHSFVSEGNWFSSLQCIFQFLPTYETILVSIEEIEITGDVSRLTVVIL